MTPIPEEAAAQLMGYFPRLENAMMMQVSQEGTDANHAHLCLALMEIASRDAGHPQNVMSAHRDGILLARHQSIAKAPARNARMELRLLKCHQDLHTNADAALFQMAENATQGMMGFSRNSALFTIAYDERNYDKRHDG